MRAAVWTESPTYPVSVSAGRPRGTLEHGERVVAPSGYDMAVRGAHCRAHNAADVTEHAGIPIAEATEQVGRALDIGQQERDLTRRELELWLQLRADEADRHDAVFLGRPQ